MFKSKNTKLISFLAIFFVLASLLFVPQAVKAGPPECDGKKGKALQKCVEDYLKKETERRCGKSDGRAAYLQCKNRVLEDYIDAEIQRNCPTSHPNYPQCAQDHRDDINNGDYAYGDTSENGEATGDLESDCNSPILSAGNCRIVYHLLNFINILSALVGITAVIMLTVWGIQYTVSRDNPQMVASARLKILNTVLAVVFYLFIYAFLQWLVPGGVF